MVEHSAVHTVQSLVLSQTNYTLVSKNASSSRAKHGITTVSKGHSCSDATHTHWYIPINNEVHLHNLHSLRSNKLDRVVHCIDPTIYGIVQHSENGSATMTRDSKTAMRLSMVQNRFSCGWSHPPGMSVPYQPQHNVAVLLILKTQRRSSSEAVLPFFIRFINFALETNPVCTEEFNWL